MEHSDVLNQRWSELRSRIRPRWMALTDEDVTNIRGDRDALVVLLREKYGYSEIQAIAEVDRFMAENAAPMAAQLR